MNAKLISGQSLSRISLFNFKFPKPKRTFIDFNADDGWVLIGAQIIWWGLGLTLAYDICEDILHWPHWVAMVVYSALTISSAWFRNDVLVLIGLFTMPSLLGVVYFTMFPAHQGTSLVDAWGMLLHLKSFEYLGWFLMVFGCFMNAMLLPTQRPNVVKALCYLCMILGAAMMLKSALAIAQHRETPERLFLLLQQVSYFLWIFGVSYTKTNQSNQAAKIRSHARWAILCVGVFIMLLFDIIFLNMTGILKYVLVFMPPLSIMILSKYLSFLSEF